MHLSTLDLAPGYDSLRVREAIRDNLWLHFTQMSQFKDPESRPLVLVKGQDTTVWDDQGKGYLDLLAGIYSVNAGYGKQRIIEAMMAQLEQ
jgi:adenosylmethionine-8-amino-7-oxononanoate aminotransferase